MKRQKTFPQGAAARSRGAGPAGGPSDPAVVRILVLSLLCLCTAATAPGRTIAAFAGEGTAGFTGDNGPAASAELRGPTGLCRGPDGAMYVCDTDNHVIRKVTPDGVISTVAGTGKAGYAGDGGPATRALLNDPYEVRFDKAGNLYFVERLNHVVRRIDAKTQTITTFAGHGQARLLRRRRPRHAGAVQASPTASSSAPTAASTSATSATTASAGSTPPPASSPPSPAPARRSRRPTAPTSPPPRSTAPAPSTSTSEGNLWLALREGNAVYRLDLKVRHHPPRRRHRQERLHRQRRPRPGRHLLRPQGHQRRPRRQRLPGRHREPQHPQDRPQDRHSPPRRRHRRKRRRPRRRPRRLQALPPARHLRGRRRLGLHRRHRVQPRASDRPRRLGRAVNGPPIRRSDI